jgi:hypothetical protein
VELVLGVGGVGGDGEGELLRGLVPLLCLLVREAALVILLALLGERRQRRREHEGD